MKNRIYDVIIIGGGLAGLTCALHLSKQGIDVLLIEKDTFPDHKVCGEYISNEVLPYLNSLAIDPLAEGAISISKLKISNYNNKEIETTLPLGGFGMSRYYFDNLLFKKVKEKCKVVFKTVESISFQSEIFTVTTQDTTEYKAKYVVGAHGKRSNIDKKLNRKFSKQQSPWLAVKAHYDYEFPLDTVALHTFKGGYCGLSKTETGAVNACYLTTYTSFKKYKGIEDFQKNNLSKNPNLKQFFSEATPLFDSPLTIGQISFQPKNPVENHIFMIGDSAGLIHPLCGNGMAMAIHSAKLFSELFLKQHTTKKMNRSSLEKEYEKHWNNTFSNRLKTGRYIQKLLMNETTAGIGFSLLNTFPNMLNMIIRKTHGNPIQHA
ncbi:NAD(P)/FAD-dependent oxidoreductase [Marixanthomonas ophiurae]|uniref:NAD(P)/FAD-dependent oxidoreductase n=1 Tax=Marixanthomonas ophiurae TaxID=387659 RepID=A0A3E1Q7M6_9FLAO|nr:NAD(P)/FAD-dependent oxidoreductase [Marixanthomonas ophiurae]RFN58122.1 NAD(P)/FAD-dependent oxidoreductase [Marixanthomonas ophiurae]